MQINSLLVYSHILWEYSRGQLRFTPTGIHTAMIAHGHIGSLYAVRKAFKYMKDYGILGFHGNHYSVNFESGILYDILDGLHEYNRRSLA